MSIQEEINHAKNASFETQVALLEKILLESPVISQVLSTIPKLNLPNWYLAAGCVFQTVWNRYYEMPPTHGIKDCDLVYFDNSDTSYEAEDVYVQQGKVLFKEMPIEVEIRNEARVHLWYTDHFKGAKAITPYISTEDAIISFPTTSAAIGVRHEKGKFIVYAPFGLDDLFGMVVRPNKKQITQAMYTNKIIRWEVLWPKLTIIPWNN